MARLQAEIPDELFEWYKTTYPRRISEMVTRAMSTYRDVMLNFREG